MFRNVTFRFCLSSKKRKTRMFTYSVILPCNFRCDGHACLTGLDARWNLYRRDITLYGILLEVYFNNNVNIQPGLDACTKLH